MSDSDGLTSHRFVGSNQNMAHLRKRFLYQDFHKLLKYSPIVGILGHRQTGKTTFVSEYCDEYITLDKKEHLDLALKNPEKLIRQKNKKLICIDECQLAPPLFPALKEWVRLHKRPGQFVMTGSVRFSSRKAIRESLTGRILNLEMLPMSISEIQHKSKPDTLVRLLASDNLKSFIQNEEFNLSLTKKLNDEIDLYLERGGLPGICFVRDNRIRTKKIEELIQLILDRDLRQIHETQLSLDELMEFMRYLAINEGQPLNHSEIEREIKISDVTQKKLLYALESIFVLRQIPISGGIKSKTYYFEDQGEHRYFSIGKNLKGQIEGLVFRHARVQFQYGIQEPYQISQYLSRSKARVPFVISQGDRKLGLLPILTKEPTHAERQAGNSMMRSYGSSKVLFLSLIATEFQMLSDRSLIAPIYWIV